MSYNLQFKRYTSSGLSSLTGLQGELFVDTSKNVVVVQDGSTAGGHPLQKELVSGTNIKTINGTSILGSGDLTISGGGGGSLTAVTSDVLPSVSGTYNIGSSSYRWNQVLLSDRLDINGAQIVGVSDYADSYANLMPDADSMGSDYALVTNADIVAEAFIGDHAYIGTTYFGANNKIIPTHTLGQYIDAKGTVIVDGSLQVNDNLNVRANIILQEQTISLGNVVSAGSTLSISKLAVDPKTINTVYLNGNVACDAGTVSLVIDNGSSSSVPSSAWMPGVGNEQVYISAWQWYNDTLTCNITFVNQAIGNGVLTSAQQALLTSVYFAPGSTFQFWDRGWNIQYTMLVNTSAFDVGNNYLTITYTIQSASSTGSGYPINGSIGYWNYYRATLTPAIPYVDLLGTVSTINTYGATSGATYSSWANIGDVLTYTPAISTIGFTSADGNITTTAISYNNITNTVTYPALVHDYAYNTNKQSSWTIDSGIAPLAATSTSLIPQYSTVIGFGASASSDSETVIGTSAQSNYSQGTLVGKSAQGYGTGATGVGYGAFAGAYGTAIGSGSVAQAYGVGLGVSNQYSYAIQIGNYNNNTDYSAASIGLNCGTTAYVRKFFYSMSMTSDNTVYYISPISNGSNSTKSTSVQGINLSNLLYSSTYTSGNFRGLITAFDPVTSDTINYGTWRVNGTIYPSSASGSASGYFAVANIVLDHSSSGSVSTGMTFTIVNNSGTLVLTAKNNSTKEIVLSAELEMSFYTSTY